MKNRTRFHAPVLGLLLSLALISSSSGSQNRAQNASGTEIESQPTNKENVVYVCACLKTKSCFCMTEAKMEGPCACGTSGGPPMKAVPPDSDWAKQNRDALASK
jgi:hypothetical protein